MFDFVRKHTRLFQFVLLILILPSFVLLGVEGYSRFLDGSNSTVAEVAGQKVTQAEWDKAQRDQVDRMRQQMPTADAKLFDSPEMRKNALENLVRERVLAAVVANEHRGISDEQLLNLINTDPQLAPLRNVETAKQIAAQQGLSVDGLLQRLRQEIQTQSVLAPIAQSAVPSPANAALAFDALLQQRALQFQAFSAKDFAATLKPTDAELETYYKDPKIAAKFQLPESAEIEYVVLDAAALAAAATVTDADLQTFYKDNAKQLYTAPEERRASHILVKTGDDMSAADKAKAKTKAEQLLAEVRKNPASFADVAKKNSDDPGSAQNGGDLGFFGHKAMVESFEKAAFSLKKGEISDLVESPFGFHIIEVTDVRGGESRPFESVKADIEAQLRKQLGQKRFSEISEDFNNTAYENDGLKPVSDKFKLAIQKANVQRKASADASGVLASQKLLDAVFTGDVLAGKRNTEATDVGNNQLVSAHVAKHLPSRAPSLADVKPALTAAWVQDHAAKAAEKAGQARLAELQKGGDVKGLSEVLTVSRAKPGPLSPKALDQVLRADATKLPAYVGVDSGDAYLVVRIDKIVARDPALIDAARASEQYSRAWAMAEMTSYYNVLKAEYKATIKPSALKAAEAASAPTN